MSDTLLDHLARRLLDKVDRSGPPFRELGPCWLWPGYLAKGGYAKGALGGRRGMIHRLAYELLVGPIPQGLTLDHLCRVRRCVNPAHLEPVTMAENLHRGNTLPAINAAKTHCPSGHPYDVENTYVNPSTGRRTCRACQVIHQRTWRQRRRALERSAS